MIRIDTENNEYSSRVKAAKESEASTTDSR